MRPRSFVLSVLWPVALAAPGLVGCAPQHTHASALCAEMAPRCGGAHADNWEDWCNSGCVPESARVACDANAACLLCAHDDADAGIVGSSIEVFGFPADDIEFLWTQILPRDAPPTPYPPSEPAPTGGAFDDRAWASSPDPNMVGPWRILQPGAGAIEDADVFFCEPGPNLYTRANVDGGDVLAMRAVSLPSANSALHCPGPFCASGPYDACDVPAPSECPYGDAPETVGYGSSSQVDRGGDGHATYGYGTYRATLRASGPTTGPVSGTVYAFFSQSNEPCQAGEANAGTNTAEVDVELSGSNEGTSGGLEFCDASEMCFIVSTWTSSSQGLPAGLGHERHQVSGFRFRDRASAGQLRTYGYEWREHDVRFTYDVDPLDCDEAAGGCTPEQASVGICEHTHFVPRRPSPLHFQLWNSWWGGTNAPGTQSEMTVSHVWHVPR